MAEHLELLTEIPTVEKMTTAERLKHAKKRRSQQMKKWANYEKALEKRKKGSSNNSSKKMRNSAPIGGRNIQVKFTSNVMLLDAATRNDIDEVRKLLMQKVNPDVTNEDGLSALHQCCIDDNEEMLKLLLEFGATVNARDSERWTPLHAAATCGHVHLCKHLIENGAGLLAVNADGNMPYDICEDEVTLDYVETEMAKRGITQEDIDGKRLEIEKQMLDDLKSIESDRGNLEFRNKSGATPLHIAAANGYIEVVEFLLDHHVSVDIRDVDSWQPIHAAACWMQPEILEILVRNGADIDARTRNSETAFDLCEDPEIKQKILDMKDELEHHRAISKDHIKRHKINTRGASLRRSSMRGEKNPLFMKEAKEEALHFGIRANVEDDLVEDEKENLPATNIDDVTLILDEESERKEAELDNDTDILYADDKEVKELPNSHMAPAQQRSSPELRSDTRNLDQSQSSNSSHPTKQDVHQTKPLTDDRKTGSSTSNKPSPPEQNQHSKPDHPDSQKSHNQTAAPSRPAQNSPTSERNQAQVRYPSGVPHGTLSDLKKMRAEQNKLKHPDSNTIEGQVQTMFLNSLNSPDRYKDAQNRTPSPQTSKQNFTQNGHNNNHPPYSGDRPLRKFVAPGSAAVVGGDDEKQSCCVLM